MHEDAKYDFLLSPASTREVWAQHRNDDAQTIALVRAALKHDAREQVRRNAVVALTASLMARGVPDYIAALGDPSLIVAAEAAYALATYGPASLSGTENEPAMTALRGHAPLLRALLASPSETARFNAATALRVIADPDVPLAKLLGDDSALVRREGLDLAARRSIGAPELQALAAVAERDPDPQLRITAVNTAVDRAPQLAGALLASALERGDVDRGTAQLIAQHELTTAVPGILAYIAREPRAAYFFETLAALGATCAARAIAAHASDAWATGFAIDALRVLSGHADWSRDQLFAWAAQQADDAPPCRA
jgi:HEAT repeat protein